MANRKTKASPRKNLARRSILSDETYDLVKAMIFDHKILPGARVNIDAISIQLGVSQTPVREALAQLESEGLIEKEALKGYRATKLLSVSELESLFEFRLLIEPWSAAQAAKKIDSVGKAALKAEMQSAKTAIKFDGEEKMQALTEHDARFHGLIASISGNQILADAHERTHSHLHLFRIYLAFNRHLGENEVNGTVVSDLFKEYYQTKSGQLAIEEHQAIADAILKGNSKAATQAMTSHIASSLRRWSPALKKS